MKIERIKTFIRTREIMDYLDQPNINSVGIGYKRKKGKLVNTGRGKNRKPKICIQFTVDRKFDLEEQPEMLEEIKTRPITPTFEIDGEQIETDVLERQYKPAYEVLEVEDKTSRKQRLEPIVPGISISHVEGSAGTFGSVVYDRNSGDPFLLSNWHVLHTGGGDVGDAVVQPGPFDDANIRGNEVGVLVRSHLGLAGDCAVCSTTERDFETQVLELGITPARVGRAELDDHVVKSGRTTGVTRGIVTRIEVTTNLNYPGVGPRKIGGFEIGPDPAFPAADNEISRGGDSGATWLATDRKGDATDVVLGLHFAGESSMSTEEYALACNINSVLTKLNVGLAPPLAAADEPEVVARAGYDEDFLTVQPVPFPYLIDRSVDELLEVDGVSLFDYHHFSLAMNRVRRLAIYTAHNIDGQRKKTVSGGLGWNIDRRVGAEHQLGEVIYADNPWDRGHLVRRDAVVWGSLAQARRANRDTYHFTNAAPQHRNFNRDEWVFLEDWVLDGAVENNYRACVFTGPVFTDQDELYRGIRIPAGFWKVIVSPRAPHGQVSTVAFLMNQYDFLHDSNGRRFLELRLYQVAVETVEELAFLEFDDDVKALQPESVLESFAVPEGVVAAPWPTISGPADIRF
jgi:endonuclease G